MPAIARCLLVFLCAAALGGCSTIQRWLGRKPKPKATPVVTLAVGTIAGVSTQPPFALVDAGTFATLGEGKKLLVLRHGFQVAELKTTGLRKHPFVVADVLSGEPRKGDQVYRRTK